MVWLDSLPLPEDLISRLTAWADQIWDEDGGAAQGTGESAWLSEGKALCEETRGRLAEVGIEVEWAFD